MAMNPVCNTGPVLVALSGGVDSSVAVSLLRGEGRQVIGAYMVLHDPGEAGIATAQAAAEALGIPFRVLNLRETFSRCVLTPFQQAWADGLTPNPCVGCNRTLKFGALLDAAHALGCSQLATGHYARTKLTPQGRTLLMAGVDQAKDQSYFLSRLSQEQLAAARFPLGELTKPQVRQIAGDLHLPSAQSRESQDVCFIPDGDYAAWLEGRGFRFTPGNFILADGTVLAPHQGAERLTIGQRRGLGIALGQRSYVTARRGPDLVVGPQSDLLRTRVYLSDLNCIPFQSLQGSVRVTARLRYRHRGAPAWLHPVDDATALLEFDQPQRAPAPGQTAVGYDGDTVVFGGEIISQP